MTQFADYDNDDYYTPAYKDDEDDDYDLPIRYTEYGDPVYPDPVDLDVEREALKWRRAMETDMESRPTRYRDSIRPEEVTKDLLDHVANLLLNERKIEAIKIVRGVLQLGLKEAKDWVEEFADNNGLSYGSYRTNTLTVGQEPVDHNKPLYHASSKSAKII